MAEGWAPVAASCSTVVEYLEGEGASEYTAPPESGPVVISLRLEGGELAADPPKVAVRQGQAVQWVSDTLDVWGVRFLEKAPAPKAPAVISAVAKGKPAPAADVGQVTGDCGRYYYVASAVHPETGQMLILDPPIMVRN